MENNEQFNLGEALGGYEQAAADRDFYLSMVQGGTQAASPIAAYLAGVAGVKMKEMRAQVQAAKDERQAKLDAEAAAEKVQKRRDALQGQIVNIMKGARDGSLAPGAAAAMLGPLMKEAGYNLKQYDADNNQAVYNIPGDSQDYVFDLGESETSKSQRDWYKLQLAKEKEERQARQGERRLNIEQQRADTAKAKAGTTNEKDSWTTFQKRHGDTIEYLSLLDDEQLKNYLRPAEAEAFIESWKALPESRRKSLESDINRLRYLFQIKDTATPKAVSLNELW